MRIVESPEPPFVLLWIRAAQSDTEVASFAPRTGGVRIIGPERAPDSLALLARDPERACAVVVIESGVQGFEALCERLSAMSPAPRVIVVYPKTRVLSAANRLPDMAAGY
jgi:hypothetical protein